MSILNYKHHQHRACVLYIKPCFCFLKTILYFLLNQRWFSLIIDWFLTIFTYIEQPVNKKTVKIRIIMENVELTQLQKNLFVLSLIVGILEKKLRESLKTLIREWWKIITSLVFLLVFGGIYFMLPNWSIFFSHDDFSCTKGKIFFTAFVTTLICESINQIINRNKLEERKKRFGIILGMLIISIIIVSLI